MVQIIPQTHEEKLQMYMKCKKKELALMLIEANRHLENLTTPLRLYSTCEQI